MTARSSALFAVLLVTASALEGCGGAVGAARAPAAPASVAASTPHAAGGKDDASRESATSPKMVRDAQLAIEVNDDKDIPRVLRRAHDAAAKLGGYVSSETGAEVVMKVPDGRLDEALDTVQGSGDHEEHVAHREITARDITAAYTDLGIRIDNARKLATRLKELESQTTDVARLLDIEKELARVTTELESMEGEMRLLDNTTTFATATVEVSTVVRPGPVGWVFYGLFTGVKWLIVWN
jgi:hypothetical protein